MKATILNVLFLLGLNYTFAQINWPAGQVLPSFPTTAQHQDFIYMNGTSTLIEKTWRWEAESASIGHGTGRLETDGWLCQVGIDAPNKHMMYGPYDKSVTAGPNIAEFRIKTDNNTANDAAIVDIDVRNATTGEALAFKTITRKQFPTAGDYTTFQLPFVMPADNQSIEIRVNWYGAGYTKVDWVSVKQDNKTAETYLFASLKGLVNRTQPRIFSYEGDNFAEGPFTWLNSLGLSWTEYPNRWDLIAKYKNEIAGLIVYDPAQTHTVNLATMLAKDQKALIASPSLVARLTAAPYNFPILTDLRGQFNTKLEVYQKLYTTYWPKLDKRVLIGLSPEAHKGSVREYACALGTAVIWLDPQVAGESELLNSFLASMPTGANYLGWWPEEGAGITRASQYAIPTIASDYATNLTVHSGTSRTINIKPAPPKPALQNKIYVAFVLSDGDNLQYVEHLMRKLWNNPDRGAVPIGWTVSPAMLDAMPGALDFYHRTATDNDNLISGPSGYGYIYPNNYPNATALNNFISKTEDYNLRSGLRVTTIWNTIVGGINQNVGESFATFAPTLLGVTGQNTGGPLSIYKGTLPGKPLSCNYCTNEQAMKDHIASASNGWNRAEPRFVVIQAQPWTDVKPSNFKNVANSLNSDYVVVRPDHLFQLLREHKGLEVNPGAEVINPSRGIVTAYVDCDNKGYSAGFNVGDYNLNQLNTKRIKNDNLSSLSVMEGFKAVLYQDDNFLGQSTDITSNITCLNGTWNNKTSSLKVLPNGERNKNGTYFIKNRASDLYIEVKGGTGATQNGAKVIQTGFNGNTNQQFELTDRGDGSYSVIATHSALGLDVEGISTNAGAKILQWNYVGGGNQQFILVPAGNGFYKLIAKHTGMVLETSTNTNGEQLHQWWNHEGANAQWELLPNGVVTGNNDQLKNDLILYPNPVENHFTIQLPNNAKVDEIEVLDLSGRIVLATKGNQNMDISNLKSGIYFVIIKNENGVFKTRITKL